MSVSFLCLVVRCILPPGGFLACSLVYTSIY